ncbi:ABC-type polysaccharide/polyol phosphate transport system [Commensalibacter communis]|uniref:ATPase component (TagH) n=1 Tax=Commensalibacter communis TaxID=2972786 RepID=A0A9W4TPT5_9PROT|nr:ABC transporter ATP-binding protein [Commensalibacter communis]CAI3929748.1 ABC-type polysaccharide/polyol phosphate transport system [Commensalibacter communis]CAI3931175.1 ABC-type polysaccharide/polyol phosphate transport system [Commensalibacter communis]CAI3931325.1 ABC-type polysaccharide/polyol phosphate transport system [Commensalibacter communis]CAI3931725.1 ABC-type polysaccharide/polyol phosphate transport system [Commensalibacter communis]
MPSITVKNLSISFPLYHENTRSLRKMTHLFISGRLRQDQHKKILVQSLRDINFTLRQGDKVGLIGQNGAGKTTLLRTMTGIYEPVVGHIRVEGSISTLLDPNAGMNFGLTGRENIYLKCSINGYSKKQTQEIAESVADFSELGAYLDLPVRTYSSGMQLRLGFGLATAIAPQILMMDEWFLTGDAGFIQKATKRIENMVQNSQILVISTHSAETIAKWCNRVLWLDQGFLKMDGTPEEVLPIYLNKPYEEIVKKD